ncbi:pyridine nucleotide-disulfide oxidoreductase [Bifidobacterium italicum]|uniref:Pyridine nucleotide-disulfide oxidoreductase n=1 Tax=Bifidobacterium italicum TaxID=1960968 RepID=A0A2A2EL64_9BIFI|nr:FAD-dependent oxidoreductase [Bifidobacterium italicum]PAU69678.1 pyridine nucleotide-disulfide oxidoreductase [Bifidobacterium italicum]
MTTVAIIGCTHAGTFAASSILHAHPDWDVHVFERNATVSFLSCGIALWVGDHVSDPRKMFYSSPAQLEAAGATMHMRTDVTDVHVAAKTLEYRDLETGDTATLPFDKLVVTTGSRPVVPSIPGVDSKRVQLCKNWDDAIELKERSTDAKSVVVIGAGYIGAELAEQFSGIGVETTLVDAADRVLANNFDKPITDQVEERYRAHGVTLALGEKVVAFRDNDGDDTVTVVTDGGEYTAQFAVLAVGFLPNTDLVRGQLDMMDNGAIVTNEYMQTSTPYVYAAGDSATVLYNPTGAHDYIPLATNAVRQGMLVGANIERPTRKYMGTQATSAVQLYDLSLSASGLTQGGADRRGMDIRSTELVEDYRPTFMTTTAPVTSILTWDPNTRLVKGAQFCSSVDVSGAANVVSVAIQARFTIDMLADVDFLFQPNFDQPIYYVGAVASKAVAEQGD